MTGFTAKERILAGPLKDRRLVFAIASESVHLAGVISIQDHVDTRELLNEGKTIQFQYRLILTDLDLECLVDGTVENPQLYIPSIVVTANEITDVIISRL